MFYFVGTEANLDELVRELKRSAIRTMSSWLWAFSCSELNIRDSRPMTSEFEITIMNAS